MCYEFLSRIASSVLRVKCYQRGSCVGGPSAFNFPFGLGCGSGLSITLSSLALSWVYRLPFFKSLVWLGCDSNSQPPVLVASTLPLHYQSVVVLLNWNEISQNIKMEYRQNYTNTIKSKKNIILVPLDVCIAFFFGAGNNSELSVFVNYRWLEDMEKVGNN